MNWLQQINVEKFLLFTLVLVRVSGLVMVAPIYGTREAPAQVRVFLAIALALLITPTQWQVSVVYPETMLNYLVFIGGELLIGLCLGLGIVVIFSGMQLAGEMIGYASGLMLADVYDPSIETNVPLFSRLMYLVAVALFVCIGGHRIVMAGLLDTFQSLPPGSVTIPDSLAETFTTLLAESFSLAIRASIPVVTALLLATLVLGLVGRAVPQLNVLSLGFGLNAMLTFAALALTLGASAWAFQEAIQPALEILLDTLKAPMQTHWLV